MLRMSRDVLGVLVVTCALLMMTVVTDQDSDEYDSDQNQLEGYGSDGGVTYIGEEEGEDDEEEEGFDTAKSISQYQQSNDDDPYGEDNSDGYEPQTYDTAPSYHSRPKKQKKVYVPIFVPEKEKKKMKIISVDKGFYIMGGTQISGKFRSLKHCMKACAVTPTCFSGDFNPWLHKCYMHTNYTACNTLRSHPQYIHFSKVPCALVDAPTGNIALGVQAQNGIEAKGIDSLQQCIKKCVSAGGGVPASAATLKDIIRQACFAIDYDFATHKCFFFGANINVATNVFLHCVIPLPAGVLSPTSLGAIPNPTVVHITFCPLGPKPAAAG